MNNIGMIAASLALKAINSTASLQEQFRQAAESVKANWLGHTFDDDGMFSATVGALLVKAKDDGRDEDVERIEAELRRLKGLAAACDGVPVNLSDLLEAETAMEPIGMVGLWQELKAAKNPKESPV